MNRVELKKSMNIDYKTSESLKSLRVGLDKVTGAHSAVVFTSVMGREGKTFVSYNMAVSSAVSGKRTLYIDANLRAAQNPVYDMAGNTLADYLNGKATKEQLICSTEVENLYIIQAGGPQQYAAELLERQGYAELITELKKEYDTVYIDTPAVGEVTDAMIIGAASDGVVLVVEPEIVPKEQAVCAKEQMERVGSKLLGIIMNKCEAR